VAEEPGGAGDSREDETAQALRSVFQRAWPVDRTPIFSGLVRAIDDFDREQRRRRKQSS
jgi:hypothetical protein